MGELPDRGRILLDHDDPETRLWAGLASTLAPNGRLETLDRAVGSAPAPVLARWLDRATPVIRSDVEARRRLLILCEQSASPRLRLSATLLTSSEDEDEARRTRDRLARDTHWFLRVASACTEGATRSDVATAVATAPPGVPQAVRNHLDIALPVTWSPRPTVAGWSGDETPLDEGIRMGIHAALRRAYDELGTHRVPTDEDLTRTRWRWLPHAADRARSLASIEGDGPTTEFYERLVDSLRSHRIPEIP
jgi:hypothetical protein